MNSGDILSSDRTISVRVLEVSQPIGLFYVGIMKASDLKLIAAADVRRKVKKEEDTYTGIQRELNKKRQIEIRDYISSVDASFPNSFIVSINSDDIIEQNDNVLKIRADEKVASIIHGQHRLAGFEDSTAQGFDLIVSIFVDLPIEHQAMLFATINLKQTRVNPSLVYDLYEETKLRSPQKTCHTIAKTMNNDHKSPFFRRIKPLGKRTDEYSGLITQATFVKHLLPHIAENPDKVKNQIKRKIPLDPKDAENRHCIFWQYFAKDEDWAILKILNNYFGAVASALPGEWDSSDSPLARTIGFTALMRIIKSLYELGYSKGSLEQSFFEEYFRKAQKLTPFTFDKYPASGKGERKLYEDLAAVMIET
jgi:DGQHR domain-containing protein